MRIALTATALILASLPGVGLAAPTDQTTAPAAQPFGGLIIQSDLVIGAPGPCALQSRFQPGDRVVFRAKILDAQTGQVVPDAEATVRLADGTTIRMVYGDHPPPQLGLGAATDQYWVAVWAIRPDAPLGVMRYTIEATAGTRTGRFEPFDFERSLLTIVPPS